jgi:hypothetical protein
VVLEVPEQCNTSVVVIQRTDFGSLQRGVASEAHGMQLGPCALGRRTKLACGQRSSVALMRSLRPDDEAEYDHLVSLPRAERIAAGTTTELSAPALLVVGTAAVAVMPGATVHRDSMALSLSGPSHDAEFSSGRGLG